MNFREASRVERVGDDLFEGNVPDEWQQGRGAFGGLILGIVLRAARAYESDEARAVRTLSADIAGPVMVGPVRLRVRTLRRGQSQTNLQIDLEQQGAVLTSALCTLSAARRVDVPGRMPEPPAGASADWTKAEVLPLRAPAGPVFAKHYEYRLAGPMPFSGSDRAESVCFLRERDGAEELDACSLVGLLDAPWPSLFGAVRKPYPMGTVSFSAQFMPLDLLPRADQPLYSPGRMHVQHQGYCLELRELWAGDRLVATAQQTMAVLR